jgi:hypothetical protein
MEEQRRAYRQPAFIKMKTTHGDTAGYILNISKLGVMLLGYPSKIPKNKVTKFQLSYPNTDNTWVHFSARIRIIWWKERGDVFEQMGGEFTEVPASHLDSALTYFSDITIPT